MPAKEPSFFKCIRPGHCSTLSFPFTERDRNGKDFSLVEIQECVSRAQHLGRTAAMDRMRSSDHSTEPRRVAVSPADFARDACASTGLAAIPVACAPVVTDG